MSVLVVGSVALDSVETPFGTADRVVGGSANYFAAAASLFGNVNVVGVVGEDYPMEQLSFLEGRGVDFSGVTTAPGEREGRKAPLSRGRGRGRRAGALPPPGQGTWHCGNTGRKGKTAQRPGCPSNLGTHDAAAP